MGIALGSFTYPVTARLTATTSGITQRHRDIGQWRDVVGTMHDTNEETIHLACDTLAVRSARHHVASMLHSRGWREVDVERAQLAVAELVANAVVHARTESTLRVHVDGSLRLEVVDGAPGADLQPRELDPQRVGGLGLQLIDQLSSDWGVDSMPAGKAVWCEVPQTEPVVPTRRPESTSPQVGLRRYARRPDTRSPASDVRGVPGRAFA